MGLMIVITLMAILTRNAPGRGDTVIGARETALHQDLFVMRQAIQEYTLDKKSAPQSLDDLVDAKYLRMIPPDPITRKRDWVTETSDVVLSPDQAMTGISDVHSMSGATSRRENTPYDKW
jgi:general secretion pathway protein G